MNNSMNRAKNQNESVIQTEVDLIDQIKQDPSAFGKLYDLYVESVFRYIYNRTGNHADAEDLTAQTFLSALEGIQHYRENGHFAAWLFSIARRKTIDHYRSHRPQTELDEAVIMIQDNDPVGEIIRNERKKALKQLIQSLPEHEKELIRLRYLAELNFADIARLLKRSESATKKAFYRLIARLHNQMEVSHD